MSDSGDSERGGKFQTVGADDENHADIGDNSPKYSPTSPAKSDVEDSEMEAGILEELSEPLTATFHIDQNLHNFEKLKEKLGK